MLALLPASIQQLARNRYIQFLANPFDPALHNHELTDGGRGQHRAGSRAVWITQRYRAIDYVDGSVNVWYWVGSHSAYNLFTGRNG